MSEGEEPIFKNYLRILESGNHEAVEEAACVSGSHDLEAHAVTLSTNYGRTAVWYRDYYGFPTVSQNSTPVIAIISLGGYYLLSDLQKYWKTVCGLAKYPTVLDVAVGQTRLPTAGLSGADLENTLDLEIAGALCPSATLLFISAPNSMVGFLQAVQVATNAIKIGQKTYKPQIVSISWGLAENPANASLTASMRAMDSAFADAARRGVCVLTASGDSGASDGMTDGLAHVDFPSSSPSVIAVGGTSVASAQEPETAWSWNSYQRWGGGGGLSSLFPSTAWQESALSQVAGLSSSSVKRRPVPDVAASADPSRGYTITYRGQNQISAIGNTSCAAPLIAGFLACLSPDKITYLSQNLYTAFAASARPYFRDVTVGANGPSNGPNWKSLAGFDMCTGLGALLGAFSDYIPPSSISRSISTKKRNKPSKATATSPKTQKSPYRSQAKSQPNIVISQKNSKPLKSVSAYIDAKERSPRARISDDIYATGNLFPSTILKSR